MKNYPKIRYILLGLMFLVVYLIGLIIYPFVYSIRGFIRRNDNTLFLLWIFLNDSEDDDIDDDFGPQWFRDKIKMSKSLEEYNWIQKLYISYYWSAVRNPHWNLKLLVAPKEGKPINIQPEGESLLWRNYNIWGKQSATYYIDDVKYFRYSFTKTILWGKMLWNMQLGASTNRYIYKNRFKLIK